MTGGKQCPARKAEAAAAKDLFAAMGGADRDALATLATLYYLSKFTFIVLLSRSNCFQVQRSKPCCTATSTFHSTMCDLVRGFM